MGSRRKFLGGVLAAGAGLGLGARSTASSLLKQSREGSQELKVYVWQKTIFCQVQDARLLAAVGQQAWNTGLDLFLGMPDHPDLFATPCFIAILDRRTVPPDVWEDFLGYRWEVKDQTPILLVDDLGTSAPYALDAGMQVVEAGTKGGLRQIRQAIRAAHRVALAWQPDA